MPERHVIVNATSCPEQNHHLQVQHPVLSTMSATWICRPTRCARDGVAPQLHCFAGMPHIDTSPRWGGSFFAADSACRENFFGRPCSMDPALNGALGSSSHASTGYHLEQIALHADQHASRATRLLSSRLSRTIYSSTPNATLYWSTAFEGV